MDIIKYKKALKNEEGRLEKEIAVLKVVQDYGLDNTSDDNTLKMEIFQENLGLVENLDRDLLQIKNVLRKIDEGTFGKCDACSKPIELKRLKFYPQSKDCTQCAKP